MTALDLTRVVTVLAVGFAVITTEVRASELQDTPGRTELPQDRVVVPMELFDVQPTVEVRVNGQGPFRFLIDTGAGACGSVTAEFARRLDLQEVGEVLAGDPSGKNVEIAKRVGIDSITLGEARFLDVSMLRRDYKQVIDHGRPGIDGILGFRLFDKCLVTIDYPKRRLIIERGELPSPDGQTVLGYVSPQGVPEIIVSVGDLHVKADIDSGSMGGLALPQSLADQLQFTTRPVVVGKASTGFNEFEIKQARLDGDVRIGSHHFPHPTVEMFDLFPRVNLGGQCLKEFALAFDQANRRVRFAREDDAPIVMRPPARVGLMMVPRPEGLRVEGTVPGSPAEKAGLKPGDVVTHLNGKPTSELGHAKVRELFSTPSPITVQVERDGQSRQVTLTPSTDNP